MKKIYDPIHGYMNIDNIAIKVIDNHYFKRLKNIKQLGTCYEVFPGASHNRFEHSIGVYHLSCKMLNNLIYSSGEKKFTEKQKQLIKIAALSHDLGHGPFSHTFDEIVRKKNKSKYVEHEERSGMLIEHILQDSKFNNFKITGYDIDFIKNIIHPKNNHNDYVYQIVSNNLNGVDVDKMDYIQRDIYNIGLKYSYDYNRILEDSKILSNNICYSDKIKYQIFDMFYTRYRLHKEVYNHPVTKSIEYMIQDILYDLDDHINFSNNIDNIKFSEYDDSILLKVWDIQDSSINNAKKLMKRIHSRDIYKYIGEVKHSKNINKKFINDFIEDEYINSEDIIVQDMVLSFSNKKNNPIKNIYFYNKNNPDISYLLSKKNMTKILPEQFSERTLRLFSKNTNNDILKNIKKKFTKIINL